MSRRLGINLDAQRRQPNKNEYRQTRDHLVCAKQKLQKSGVKRRKVVSLVASYVLFFALLFVV